MAAPNHARPSELLSEEQSLSLLNQAKNLLGQGKLSESEKAFKTIISASTKPSEGYYGLGVIQIRRRDYATAAILFQSCLRLDPNNSNAYYYLGESWEGLTLPAASAAFFEKALKINPQHRGAQQKVHLKQSAPSPIVGPSQLQSVDQSTLGNKRSDATPAGFYEYISNDPSPLAKQTKQLMDAVAFTSAKPRLSALGGSIAIRLFMAFFVPLLGITIIERLNPRAGNDNAQVLLIFLGLAFVIAALVVVLRAKTTTYTIKEGRIKISDGIFTRRQLNFEIYRIEDLFLHQSLINRVTGDGILVLQISEHGRSFNVPLKGLARIEQLSQLLDNLRNLIALLRSGPWGKGIIY
jgi:tetratricopeptide (TPR) repeat protein